MDGRITRRTLLKAGLLVAIAPKVVKATPSPVFLVRTPDRAAGIRRGLVALGAPAALGKRVAIKANFNSDDPFPASTQPDTLRHLVEQLRVAGASAVTVAERSGMGDTRRGLERTGGTAPGQEEVGR